MSVINLPTLTHEEYNALVAAESGDTLIEMDSYWFQGHDPQRLLSPEASEVNSRGIIMQFLDVTEPHMYTTRTAKVIIVFPSVQANSMTYNDLAALWPSETKPWAFTIKENLYDELDEVEYFFRNGMDEQGGRVPLKKFDLADVSTH